MGLRRARRRLCSATPGVRQRRGSRCRSESSGRCSVAPALRLDGIGRCRGRVGARGWCRRRLGYAFFGAVDLNFSLAGAAFERRHSPAHAFVPDFVRDREGGTAGLAANGVGHCSRSVPRIRAFRNRLPTQARFSALTERIAPLAHGSRLPDRPPRCRSTSGALARQGTTPRASGFVTAVDFAPLRTSSLAADASPMLMRPIMISLAGAAHICAMHSRPHTSRWCGAGAVRAVNRSNEVRRRIAHRGPRWWRGCGAQR